MKFAAAILCAALAACGFVSQSVAQETDSDELVVTGERLHEIVRGFVEDVAIAAPAENQLSRWHQHFCPGVIGIQASYGQFIADRIAQRAFDVGVRTEAAGCRANVVVFVTPDATRLARAFVAQFQEAVGAHTETGVHTLGLDALQDFVETERPVRWWHVSRTVAADGNLPLGDLQSLLPRMNAEARMREQARRVEATRLERSTRQDLARVIIIVDARAAEGLRIDALADYIAMVALAQLDPDVERVDTPSILKLFDDRAAGRTPATALTDWDLAYLDGLYNATRNANNVAAQERQIVRRMVRQVSVPADQPATGGPEQ